MQAMIEITGVRQDDSGQQKRWFTSATDDLYIWTVDGELQTFEYCFDKDVSERALRWRRDFAPAFTRVDAGDHPGGHKRSPILLPEGKPDIVDVVSRLSASASSLEPGLLQALLAHINELQ